VQEIARHSLVQGLEYYKNVNASDDLVPGLMHNSLGGYLISDIKPVAAFDVDRRKSWERPLLCSFFRAEL